MIVPNNRKDPFLKKGLIFLQIYNYLPYSCILFYKLIRAPMLCTPLKGLVSRYE
jgi:hypothetical protein